MDFPKPFTTCVELRELGFPQKRKFQSMYYVRPDMLICIDDLSALKSDGHTDFENIFTTLVFKPRLEDLIEESPWLQEFIRMEDGSVFAYSTVEEDPAYIKETSRSDKFIRARGANHWEASANLYLAVKKAIQKQDGARRTLSPESLESSENTQQGEELTQTA